VCCLGFRVFIVMLKVSSCPQSIKLVPLDNVHHKRERHLVCNNQILLNNVQHKVWEMSCLQQPGHDNGV